MAAPGPPPPPLGFDDHSAVNPLAAGGGDGGDLGAPPPGGPDEWLPAPEAPPRPAEAGAAEEDWSQAHDGTDAEEMYDANVKSKMFFAAIGAFVTVGMALLIVMVMSHTFEQQTGYGKNCAGGSQQLNPPNCPEDTTDHRTAFDVSCDGYKCEMADFAPGGACCPYPLPPEPEPSSSGR